MDQKDFDCMALRACLVEGKGDFNEERHKQYLEMMRKLWQEISDLADFDKVDWINWIKFQTELMINYKCWQDGKISSEEFKDAVKQTCVGKQYSEFPKVNYSFYYIIIT